MVVTPDTNIRIIKCPIKLDESNQLTFSNATAQYNYFTSLPYLVEAELTYQRKDGVIRFRTGENNVQFEDLLQYNYVMYQNTSYDSKWFYAYVTDIKYVNDGMSEMTIETDVFQTWQFEIQYMNSFIEREHVSDDTVGAHTIPEGLETGDYVCNAVGNLATNLKDCYVGAMVTYIPDDIPTNTFHPRYGGIFCGGAMLVFDSWLSACNFTRAYDLVNKPEAITAIFMIPKALTGTISNWTLVGMSEGSHTINFQCAVVPYSDAETLIANTNVSLQTTLNGYSPKNNKMLTFPYNYFYVSNTVGADVEFHYEDFVSNAPSFKTIGSASIGCSIRTVPMNYKKLSDTGTSYNHFNAGIPAPKYPTCSWTNDAFTNWLTEQSVNNNLGLWGGVAGVAVGAGLAISGVGTVAGVGLITGGIGSIINTMKGYYEHSQVPPQAKGNTNTGDVAFASGSFEQPYYKMSVRYEYAKMIDDYFSMYGYKVNKLATPNIHKRTNWDYIKTIDVNLEGNIPENDLAKIRDLFNNGITFWHNPATFLNYSSSNSIL